MIAKGKPGDAFADSDDAAGAFVAEPSQAKMEANKRTHSARCMRRSMACWREGREMDEDGRTGWQRSAQHSAQRSADDAIPDVRDGLTRLTRVILVELRKAQAEREGRNVPTALLYGRVVEHIDVSVAEFHAALGRLVGRR